MMNGSTTKERLRRWRKVAGLTQEEAAAFFGVTLAAYRKWESLDREPTGKDFANRKAVSKVLERSEKSIEELMATTERGGIERR